MTFKPDLATGEIWKEFKNSNYVFNYTSWQYNRSEKWIYNLPISVSKKIVFLFQLLARQANSSLEANSDKRFFNVQYRKNLDNLCAPQKDFNLRKKHRIFQHCNLVPKERLCEQFRLTSRLSAALQFLCNFGNFISACLRCDGITLKY